MKSFIEVQNVEMVFTSRKGRFHALREIDLRCMHGIGDTAIERLREALASAGLEFRDG